MIGDIPFAAVRPPENILFVCKLNPVTVDEDLELIFSRFGKILSCEVVRDRKSGDSLQYAFIEFDEQDSAEQVSSSLITFCYCATRLREMVTGRGYWKARRESDHVISTTYTPLR